MKSKLFILVPFLLSSLSANECSPYYNPDKFYEAPSYLNELIEENINQKGLSLFGSASTYKTLKFEQIKDSFFNNHIKMQEYKYPLENGLFEYKVKNKQVDEISISKVELYKYSDIDIATEINDNFEEFWSDWIEDDYEMKLIPEQVLFQYQEKYFSFSVYIYGIKKDGSKLKGTVVKYWMKDYTQEVNENIECNLKRK
jgi:hypothetical protein